MTLYILISLCKIVKLYIQNIKIKMPINYINKIFSQNILISRNAMNTNKTLLKQKDNFFCDNCPNRVWEHMLNEVRNMMKIIVIPVHANRWEWNMQLENLELWFYQFRFLNKFSETWLYILCWLLRLSIILSIQCWNIEIRTIPNERK